MPGAIDLGETFFRAVHLAIPPQYRQVYSIPLILDFEPAPGRLKFTARRHKFDK